MGLKLLKEDEIAVSQNDFGILVEDFVKNQLRTKFHTTDEWMDKNFRKWWPMLEEYHQRHIMTAIELAILLDNAHSHRDPLGNKEMWQKIVADLRPPKAPYTIEYVCSKCKVEGVKLWRDSHTCADSVELECASCLVPGVTVDDKGKCQEPDHDFGNGKTYPGHYTDQVGGKVPAVPVGDTYWGYSSVPSQDVEWWKNLPTYKKNV